MMRHWNRLLKQKLGWTLLTGLLLMLAGSVPAKAQPAFNGIDWLLDRGNYDFTPTTNGAARRQGYNDFNAAANNPIAGARAWIWPFPRDLNLTQVDGAPASASLVDNPNASDPRQPRTQPQGINALSQLIGTVAAPWVIPIPADRTGRGYSITGDATQGYSDDYAYTRATTTDFALSPAQIDTLKSLPNVTPEVYGKIHGALLGDTTRAVYSAGNLGAGRYGIEIHSPGNGTYITDNGVRAAHAIASRVLVRISWRNTVNGTAFNQAGIDDPVNSRLFLVDLSGSANGWVSVQSGGLGPASFPTDGTANNQIAVTIYSLTPDSSGTDPYRIITADAVRFIPQRQDGNTNLGPINPIGRILGPAVGSDKLTNPNLVFFYVAREESVPESEIANPELRTYRDPTLPFNATTNPRAIDPTALATVPVFYCLDNRRGNTLINGREIFSYEKVRWRYVGATEGGTSGTSSASPLLANVRTRDGQVRTMLYFVTSNAGGLGRVYAFDPSPNVINVPNPRVFWTYPSIRPLTQAEADDPLGVPNQLHDPNYKNFEQGAYPAPTFGNDQPAITGTTTFYYDGEIIRDAVNQNIKILKNDVNMPAFGGIQAAPTIIDDPDNASGAQLLIIGNMNGRVYAFDAGGRGDFDPNYNPASLLNIPGTTQRIWTWPRTRADAFHARPELAGRDNPFAADEAARVNFPSSPSVDPSAGIAAPFLIGSGDGHMYALKPTRDTTPVVINGTTALWTERRTWQYPEENVSLGRAPSIAVIFQKTGSTARSAFFTCGGRVYSVNMTVSNNPTTAFDIAPLNWVYPYTPAPPNADNTVPDSNAIEPEFGGNAPVVLPGTLAYVQRPANVGGRDFCYVVTGAGKMLQLDAFAGGGRTTLVSSGSGAEAGSTNCSPIVTRISSNENQDIAGELYNVTYQPALIYSDNDGNIHGVGTEPLPDFQNNDALLPYWKWDDAESARTAAPILANGVIVQGVQGGLVYAYSLGVGASQAGDTLGSGPVPGRRRRGAGLVSIDLRELDLYTKADYDRMMLAPGDPLFDRAVTPGKMQPGGGNFNRSVAPNTNAGFGTSIIGEWGDYLYVAAWGVYKAQTTNPDAATHGTAPPEINVTFTLGGRGAPQTYRVRVPATTLSNLNSNNPDERWPDDTALQVPGETDNLSIYGLDPDSGNFAPFRGHDQQVYAWVAKTRIQISPTADKPFTPGLGSFSISAEAEVRQNIQGDRRAQDEVRVSNRFRLGQYDWTGMSTSPNPPPSSTQLGVRPREIFIANPIGVTVRGYDRGDNTGIVNSIGMGLINQPAGQYNAMSVLGEILSNGNRTFNPATLSNLNMKSLYAPVGMIQNGSSHVYSALNNADKEIAPLYLVDRSNLLATTGTSLKIQAATRPLIWHGGPSAVMNPLPWEQLPIDGLGTPDYPNISPENIRMTSELGQNATDTIVTLKAPTYDNSGNLNQRIVNPTRFDLQITVPKYQPANVNWGVGTVPNSRFSPGRQFGEGYRDITGAVRGLAGNPILGPLNVASGLVTGNVDSRYPAAGYVSEVVVVAIPPGQTTRRFTPSAVFTDFRTAGNPGLTSFDSPYRGFELGITVPPDIKLRVAESTLDIGKVPHGTGYSDIDNTGNYRAPFAPTNSLPWQARNSASPWETFFLPFTVFNESNVNLFDVRVEKLRGTSDAIVDARSLYNNPPAGVAYSTRLQSDQVNSLTGYPLLATPFNYGIGGVGNIGITSSLDHGRFNYANTATMELPLWPVYNPFVATADIQRIGLDRTANNTIAETFLPWGANLQSHPTVHKARVGDNQGTFLTVPDVPYGVSRIFRTGAPSNTFPNSNNSDSITDRKPKVSVAVPMGSASGTYASPIYAFEDGLPYQWYTWLTTFQGAGLNEVGRAHDGILNVAGTPIEGVANPTFTLKATVTEARLTQGVSKGTLSQIDLVDPRLFPTNNPQPPYVGTDSNLLPSAIFVPGNAQNQGIFAYWTSNRTLGNPLSVNRPWNIVRAALPAPGGSLSPNITPNDFRFALPPAGNNIPPETGAKWWTDASLVVGNSNAATLNQLFPQVQTGNIPGLPGVPTASTERHASPQAIMANNPSNPLDPDAFLMWVGEVDKVVGGGQQARQQTDSRMFYSRLVNGTPPANGIKSFLNDPGLTKLSPKPLYVKLGGQQYLYVFWHAGNAGQTSLYYNVSLTPDNAASWTADRKLATPNALGWQSDPQPVFRQVRDKTGAVRDAIDIIFTSVLANRQQTELLLMRYYINAADGSLTGESGSAASPALLPRVEHEALTRVGATNTYAARDAGWTPSDPDIRIELLRKDATGNITTYLLNSVGNTVAVQQGQLDKASGLLYFDSRLGGKLIVDLRSGTISFPSVAPGKTDELRVSYTPQVMRLNTNRDEAGLVLPRATGSPMVNDPAFLPHPASIPVGNYANPVAVWDKGLNGINPRSLLTAPQVMFGNGARPLDRLWVVYRKTDANGSVRSGLFYKALRLMIRLPRPVGLTARNGNGQQQIAGLTVGGNLGPYEVDWVRGRIYFTSIDEGSLITVNYTAQDGVASNQLGYRVAWGDEISVASQGGDFTTPEVLVPTDTSVNEGQVSAFKDPYSDKLWMFWTSTRNSTTDLYYQTLAPQFYPLTNNQQ